MRTFCASKMEGTLENKGISHHKCYNCQNKAQKDNGFSKWCALVASKKLLHGTKTQQQRVSMRQELIVSAWFIVTGKH